MLRSASLLAASLGGALAFPGFPSWGGADQYSVHVNLTASDVVPTGAEWGFAYYYTSDHAKNATYSRYDHAKGQRDEGRAWVDERALPCFPPQTVLPASPTTPHPSA